MEWLLAIGGFALGIVGGIFLGQSSGGSSKINKQVEEELQAVQDELNGYRNEVTMHFSKTADLFNTVTSDYHKLYQHLADGAQHFSQTDALLPDATVTKLTPLSAPVESGSAEEAGAESTEQVASEEVVASAGEGDSASETATATDATSTEKVEEAGQTEGEAAEAQATASEEVGEQAGEAQAKVSETETAETAGESETAKSDGETDAGKFAAEGSETQAGSQEEVPVKALDEEGEKPAASQPGSDADTFTVPVSEKEEEKRLH